MSDKQPEAMELADMLDGDSPRDSRVAALLRTQRAAIERKDALLRQALEAINNAHGDGLDNEVKLMNVYTAIKQELSQ